MLGLTIQQPWAWAVIHGGKSTENRTGFGTWKRAAGQTIAVHAGQRWSQRGADFEPLQRAYAEWLGFTHWDGPYGGRTAMPIDPASEERDAALIDLGAIIGLVHVRAVHAALTNCCQPWGEHEYAEHGGRTRREIVHLVLQDPRPVTPIECRGRLGLWTVPEHIAAELQAVAR